MNHELQILGENVRRLRGNLKLSQAELAVRSGLHRTYLSGVERGQRNPSFFSLVALARALEASLSELTRGVESGRPENHARELLTCPGAQSPDVITQDKTATAIIPLTHRVA
nr:DNA-binding protein [uncultured bacterium]